MLRFAHREHGAESVHRALATRQFSQDLGRRTDMNGRVEVDAEMQEDIGLSTSALWRLWSDYTSGRRRERMAGDSAPESAANDNAWHESGTGQAHL